MGSRLNWNDRQSPTDFDNTAPAQPKFDFDHRRNVVPGSASWPDKFGPGTIRKAWKAGLVVVAEIQGFPHPVAVAEARWNGGALEVKTLEGYRVAERIWTRPDTRGLLSTGELVE